MTEIETVKILAMLSAFYGQGKSDTKEMAAAWHMILKDFEYADAERAVITFARNDKREYCTFPTIGSLVDFIEWESKRANRIYAKMRKRLPYESLELEEQQAISEVAYNKALELREEELLDKHETIIEYIKGKTKQIESEGTE